MKPIDRPATANEGGNRIVLARILAAIGTVVILAHLVSGRSSGEGLGLIRQPAVQTPQFDVPDPRFGVIESFESPADADGLNAGWTRIIFQWSRAQAGGPDSWTPKITDEQIEADIAAGREVVGLLIGIPEWARDENRLPKGLWLAYDEPANTWANYVREVVTRYQGRISHWIIWNEPDIRETEIAHTWDGSVADFAQLLRVAYLTAKESDPDAVIHLSAFTYWADYYGGTEQYMARLLDEIMADPQAADHNHYFDIATAHLYFQPNQVYDLLDFFTEIMRQRGLDQPIWLAETNAPPRDDPEWPVPDWFLSVTLEEQAAFIPQALASAMAAGADRIAVYKLRDNEEDRFANPEPFGLVRMDGTHRPAYDTYRLAIEQLSGMTGVERERWDSVGQIRIDQPGKSTTVLFARLPSQQVAQVEARFDSAVLVDMWGVSQAITPDNGYFDIELSAASCSQSIGDFCMIGGLTYYLVQTEPAPPTALPPPPITATPPLTPTPPATAAATAASSAVDGSTDSPNTPPETTLIPTLMPTNTPHESQIPTRLPAVSPAATAKDTMTLVPSEQVPVNSAAVGLWFLGGGILLAGIFLSYWIIRRGK
ncbi:MAG: hypothetical protein WA996_20645 [Candidatus Promineifilaceae bacterium]